MTLLVHPLNYEFGFFDPEMPIPISRIPKMEKPIGSTSLVQICENEVGLPTVQFTQGVPLTIVKHEFCEADIVDHDDKVFGVSRFKATFDKRLARDKESPSLLPGDTLTVSVYPWSMRQLAKATFKPHSKDKPGFFRKVNNLLNNRIKETNSDYKDSLIRGALCYAALADCLETTPYEPWESNANILTAAVYQYRRFALGKLRPYNLSNMTASQMGDSSIKSDAVKEPAALLAVVRNYDEVFSRLFHSERLQGLLEKASTNKLKVPDLRKKDTRSELVAGEAFAEIAEPCMELSIAQALSGAYFHDKWVEANGPEVDRLADHIFVYHAARYEKHIYYHRKVNPEASPVIEPEVDEESDQFEVLLSVVSEWIEITRKKHALREVGLEGFMTWLTTEKDGEVHQQLSQAISSPSKLTCYLDKLFDEWKRGE